MNRFGIAAILLVCLVCGTDRFMAQEKESYYKTIGIKIVAIPAGSFMMGLEGDGRLGPLRRVSLDAFQMSATEITQAQFKSVMGYNPSYFTNNDNLPVEKASWFEAVIFCNKLSALEGLDSCYTTTEEEDYFGQKHRKCDFSKNGFRLPTEAEWEYACRAGTTTKYYPGDDESDLDRVGWYRENCGHKTHQVAQKKPNDWGLYDMHGNVWEWCNDWYSKNNNNSSGDNPTGIEAGHDHVLRGGSWPDNAGYCISANSCMIRPSYKNFGIGFRIVYRP
jgi:formylglycine-generating enzyme required for sulfatase activity